MFRISVYLTKTYFITRFPMIITSILDLIILTEAFLSICLRLDLFAELFDSSLERFIELSLATKWKPLKTREIK